MAPQRSGQTPATLRLGQLILRAVRRNADGLGSGPLILAVSGGTDSLAMLLATATVRESLGREIVVAHFSHGLRKSAEKHEAAMVRRVARELQIPLEHEQAQTGPSEASARDARYAFFGRVIASRHAALVATAHNQNDQAETLLLRLSRGTGLRGAGAIREFSRRRLDKATSDELPLLRPILAATRADTEQVCAEWPFTPASDGTNRSVRYARNRVRLRVLPELAQINPGVTGALAAFADGANEDDALLAKLAAEAVAGVEHVEQDRVTWAAHVLRELPVPLLVRVLQPAWAALRGAGAALSQAQITSIVQVLRRGSGATDLGLGATFAVEHDTATLSLEVMEPEAFERTPLTIPGETIVGGWGVTTHVGPTGAFDGNPWQATLDLDVRDIQDGTVYVRSRISGDRFQPLGMDQDVRLQDVLVNAKVPRSQRDAVPLIVVGERIAWVAGVQIAEWAKVTSTTTQPVAIEVRRLS
jgi:tRNA(Ile)-lysidine synthase